MKHADGYSSVQLRRYRDRVSEAVRLRSPRAVDAAAGSEGGVRGVSNITKLTVNLIGCDIFVRLCWG